MFSVSPLSTGLSMVTSWAWAVRDTGWGMASSLECRVRPTGEWWAQPGEGERHLINNRTRGRFLKESWIHESLEPLWLQRNRFYNRILFYKFKIFKISFLYVELACLVILKIEKRTWVMCVKIKKDCGYVLRKEEFSMSIQHFIQKHSFVASTSYNDQIYLSIRILCIFWLSIIKICTFFNLYSHLSQRSPV